MGRAAPAEVTRGGGRGSARPGKSRGDEVGPMLLLDVSYRRRFTASYRWTRGAPAGGTL